MQTAVLQVEDRNFPGIERYAKRSQATDEWYEFGPALSGQLHYLLTVDESTYQPEAHWPPNHGKGMGAFHPVSWYQYYNHGRAFYTGLGHLPGTYGDAAFLHHLYGGIIGPPPGARSRPIDARRGGSYSVPPIWLCR